MHREHPLLRERGLHNQAAEGEGDKKPQADPSTHHCPQASTSQGQDFIGNRSGAAFPQPSAHDGSSRQAAYCHPCPHTAGGQQRCYLPSIPLSLGVFLMVVGQKDGRTLLHQDGSVILSVNTFVS